MPDGLPQLAERSYNHAFPRARYRGGRGELPVTEFNHIHVHDGEDWICGRSMAFEDQELLRCESRHEEEEVACRRCASQLLAHFGDAMHVQ